MLNKKSKKAVAESVTETESAAVATAPAATPAPASKTGNKMGGHEKAKDAKKAWAELFKFCKPYMVAIILAVALAGLGAAVSVVGPNRISAMTSEIFKPFEIMSEAIKNGQAPVWTGINMSKVLNIAWLLVAIYVIAIAFNYFQGFIMATITQRVTFNLRKKISYKINRLPFSYLDGTSTGDVLSRVTNDVDTIGQSLSNSITSMVSSVCLLVGCVIMMFVTNWILALTAITTSLFGFFAMGVIMGKSQKYFFEQQESLGVINGHIEEIYSAHNVVKAYNGEKEATKAFDEINGKLYKSAVKSQFFSGLMMPLMSFVGNLGFVSVCVVGSALAFNGHMNFAVIVAFMIYVRIFLSPLGQIAQAMQNLQSTAAASERVFEFLGQKEIENEDHKTKHLETVKGAVEFKNVHFGYNPEKTVINDFSAKIKPGQKVAIVGPTGAGKTTLVNLLMRFYELNGGQIEIDGVKTSDLTRENVHDIFGMVLQDTWLFEGTIKDNIRYSKANVTDEEIEAACQAVGVHHFVKTLSNGYDTVLDDATSISAGQKQLLTIARAMVQKNPMLILDEATSSVDTRTEILIQQAMDKLTEGRTSFVIAHRLSTIKNADTILVMKDGDIIEHGHHNELMKKDGFYADLYNSQFETA